MTPGRRMEILEYGPAPVRTFQAAARTALAATSDLIDRFGPRLAGSPSCWNTAEALQREWHGIGGNAQLEPFTTHPEVFMGFTRITTMLYILGVISLHLNQIALAALSFVLIWLISSLEFGCYQEFIDPLFPRATCTNLVTTLEPRGEVKQQFILSSHHDSARETTFLRRWQKLYAFRVLLPDIWHYVGLVFAYLWLVNEGFVGLPFAAFAPTIIWFLTFGMPVVLTRYFLFGKAVTPGAGDNLIACTMLSELARKFADPHQPGKSILHQTRLLFVSFDAEECGVRGSRAFAARHREEPQTQPTYLLNIDCIYNVGELRFMISDRNDSIPLSRDLAERGQRIAEAAGYPRPQFTRMAMGGGSTDAAELAKFGVHATTLAAMPAALIRDGMVYHTLNDTVDAIEVEAVEACLHIAHGLVQELDAAQPLSHAWAGVTAPGWVGESGLLVQSAAD